MKELTNLQAEMILTTYENTFSGDVNEQTLNEVFSLLPNITGGENYKAKMRALATFVMANYDQLEAMRTTIVNKQTEHPEVSDKIATPAGTTKPKRKPRKKTRSRARAKK